MATLHSNGRITARSGPWRRAGLASISILVAVYAPPNLHADHEARWSKFSPEQTAELEKQAASGDGNAAFNLFLFNSRRDPAAAERWLLRATALRNAEAERYAAREIRNGRMGHEKFGSTKSEALRVLMTSAAATSARACYELAEAYEGGVFDLPDPTKARAQHERCAENGSTMSWTKLSDYLEKGRGGPRDLKAAYFWTSLNARTTAPASIAGKELWARRERIAQVLSPAELVSEWRRIDAYIFKVRSGSIKLDTPPFLRGMIPPRDSDESEREADKMEVEHRGKRRSGN